MLLEYGGVYRPSLCGAGKDTNPDPISQSIFMTVTIVGNTYSISSPIIYLYHTLTDRPMQGFLET